MLTPPSRSQPQPGHLYDAAVVGAGLAGCELAYRLARGGQDVLLVSQALDHLGNLYSPTIGGAGFPDGSLFAEVAAEISPQQGGWVFHRALKARLENTTGIHLLQSCVTGLYEDAGVITLSTWEGPALRATKVVLAVGAFLKARLLQGEGMEDAGRLSEVAYDFLADDLSAQGVWLLPAERRTQDSGSDALPDSDVQPDYEVRFLTVPPTELDGFALRRTDAVYALGQMTVRPDAAAHSYASVLHDAAELSSLLLNRA
jgi:tRNA U34 5-carboxymethylaminomethyl modifying enzyme MnmG/GidA